MCHLDTEQALLSMSHSDSSQYSIKYHAPARYLMWLEDSPMNSPIPQGQPLPSQLQQIS